MKDKLRPHFPRRAKDSVSSPKTQRDAVHESSASRLRQKAQNVHHFHLTSKSNQLVAKVTGNSRPKLYENARKKKYKQTPQFVKMEAQSIKLSGGQARPLDKSQTSRRESQVSAFESKLCEEFLLSQEKIETGQIKGSWKVLTPGLTNKKSALAGLGVSSSSSLSMPNKIDVKIQSVNFNGAKKTRTHVDPFSQCEISSSPTIKDVHFRPNSPRQNRILEKTQTRPESRKQDNKNSKSPFPEYGSEIIGKGAKPQLMMKFTQKTHEKLRSHLPKRVKASDELVSISSMYDHTQRKERRRKKTKQVNKATKEHTRAARKRKKLKSNDHTIQKQMLSKTVSPTHNKSKRRPTKKGKAGPKGFERLSPMLDNPAPNFPKTVAERTIQIEQKRAEKAGRRPKKVSVKNFTKSKNKLRKANKKKKSSHQERLSTKLDKFEQRNSHIKIMIRNEIINNNNNHFFNLQMQKPFNSPEFPFRPSINEGTPIYSIIPTNQFHYEDIPATRRPPNGLRQANFNSGDPEQDLSSRLKPSLPDSLPKNSLKSLNSVDPVRKNSDKDQFPNKTRFQAKDSFKLSKSRERPFKRKTPLKRQRMGEYKKDPRNQTKSKDLESARQGKLYLTMRNNATGNEQAAPEECVVAKLKARAQDQEGGTMRARKTQKLRTGKNSFKSTMERYNRKFAFGEADKKGKADKDMRKKLKANRRTKKGNQHAQAKNSRAEQDPLFYELARKNERISFNKHKFDFKKKNKVDYNEQNNKILMGMGFGEGNHFSRKNNRFNKKCKARITGSGQNWRKRQNGRNRPETDGKKSAGLVQAILH